MTTSPKRYFLFDCETGGLDPKEVSLLTLYGMILDEEFNVLREIDLRIKPSNGRYIVDIEALKINKIDLVRHHMDIDTMTTHDASLKLTQFLIANSLNEKIIPVGHNVALDLGFAQKLVPQWSQLCSYRSLDTSSLAHALQILGKIPHENKGSLIHLCDHYGIDSTGSHDAQRDVHMTHLLLKAMIKDLKGNMPNVPAVSDLSDLAK